VTRARPSPDRRTEDEQPQHRRWLHALEDDTTVPYYALQVARVISDFDVNGVVKNGKPPGDPVWVSWRKLHKCTHQRNDRLAQSLAYLTDYGWLTPEPRKNGQRQYYRLTSPAPAASRPPSNGSHP